MVGRTSRERILSALRRNQPEFAEAPAPELQAIQRLSDHAMAQQYQERVIAGGGSVFPVDSFDSIAKIVAGQFDVHRRIVTTIPELYNTFEPADDQVPPHSYEDTELAIMSVGMGVAENGAVWMADGPGHRVLPFIGQHLAVVLDTGSIVGTMHDAYKVIQTSDYGFGVFIAGPSKTADIEQSLVLGAHGPMSFTVFLLSQV
jgi:L-lactate dehydrogenase complex protein LldG